MIPPETRYTQVGDAWIGYQVLGDGPIDLVFVTGFVNNIETMWEYPPFAHFLERMASYSRLILFDPRGSGISDEANLLEAPTWEQWTEDLRAVLSAAGSERTAILAQLDGGLRAILFAATYPDRTHALILWNSYARSRQAEDYPIGYSQQAAEEMTELMGQTWGSTDWSGMANPSLVDDATYMRWAGKHLRTTMTPGKAVKTNRYVASIDVRAVLPSVRVPTLVLHNDTFFIPIELGRYVAEHIPGARFIHFAGPDTALVSPTNDVVDRIEDFLGVASSSDEPDRVLATVLFTDIVGSTEHALAVGDRRWKETLASHDRTARSQIERFHGRYVNTTGDGLLATFDGPGRAIRCAHALGRALDAEGIKIRAGLHTGEIELRDDGDIGGAAVHIAARVLGEAGPGEVICSRTVKDLVWGSSSPSMTEGYADSRACPMSGSSTQ